MKKIRSYFYDAGNVIKILIVMFIVSLIIQACTDQFGEEIQPSGDGFAHQSQKMVSSAIDESIGFQGIVFNDAITQTIPNAIITFSRSDINDVSVVVSDANGSYKIALSPAKYYVTVTASGYNSYSSAPGFFVVTGVDGYQTGNFFLDAEVPAGFQGVVFDATDFNITIPDTYITFANSTNPALVYSVYSNPFGGYKINLPQGGYFVKAEVAGYDVYDTTPGLFVADGSTYQTGNFFLTPSKKAKKPKKPKKN